VLHGVRAFGPPNSRVEFGPQNENGDEGGDAQEPRGQKAAGEEVAPIAILEPRHLATPIWHAGADLVRVNPVAVLARARRAHIGRDRPVVIHRVVVGVGRVTGGEPERQPRLPVLRPQGGGAIRKPDDAPPTSPPSDIH